MTDYVNDYLAKNRKSEAYPVAPAMFFKRGNACMSVQASSGHYCSPKNDTGPYTMVEVLSRLPRFKVPKSFGKPRRGRSRIGLADAIAGVAVSAVNEEIASVVEGSHNAECLQSQGQRHQSRPHDRC
jgi:hypothetical protein